MKKSLLPKLSLVRIFVEIYYIQFGHKHKTVFIRSQETLEFHG